MNIISYIILGLSILITLGWTLKIREKAKNEQATEKAMELQAFLMTVAIILIFLLHISPFHLLWMLPSSFFLGLLSMTSPLKFLWVFSSIYFSFWYIGISNLGRKYFVAGEYDKAVEAFTDEISKRPSSEVYFNLGLTYGKMGQSDKEIDAYEQAIKLNPKKPELYFNLGLVLKENGNKEKALNMLNEAIKLKPDYLKAHYCACKIYAEFGNNDKAKKEFYEVKKLDSYSAEELEKIITFE
ncbi:tetratricopeptide repeat protein [Flavobacterium sp. LB2P53]|uniref:tetratricopeptide repeat protein n=1 Tax=Flavobacterium sp. LB2P53 TaxID=2497481 RepID=UPI000F81BF52|nr:tetratricopeptide repeat protein [Flavobacterium sp. LB2P53]RTY65287.1 tetratricopeptide repeat protein [Flavobacterium sp. LB2P53]